ncbi:ATP-binding protein [Rhodoferax saidenbachensis]|uniref:ATP-binding protein n=1 Tax=Rhodoferax saidenbachensis TaxID=1484693 RepID=A0A1P8KEQ2_9BURK|nr:ATP-binding protein [Rhodoferax saidenbachensis]APW44517.1 ATP-binding protein [Rhodoferax saidenbachensis]
MPDTPDKLDIDAEPTKGFFVEMLTRDIALEQAVLDLVDNSIDGAKGLKGDGDKPFEGMKIALEFSKEKFRIVDNCGGFSSEVARKYAFKFGKPPGSPRTPHSIGQFGVGMKRALFKFGHQFSVRSATKDDAWAVSVQVPAWENQPGWSFPWATFTADEEISQASPGTEIIVSDLRTEVSAKFSTQHFKNAIHGLIKSKHRQFIAGGLEITVNGQHIDATSLYLLVATDTKFRPGIDEYVIEDDSGQEIKVRIVVGVGPSSPREAGWYVVCNGRVVLEADRRPTTGWGVVEEQSNTVAIPNYHNQFSRFRGIVTFDSNDSVRVPWNTTKTDVDQDNPIWQKAFGRMTEMMRPVITFLNELDADIDEHTREHSPLLAYVIKAAAVKSEELTVRSAFTAPARGSLSKELRTVKLQYAKPVDQVEFLMNELAVNTAKAVGEKTFELIYQRMGGK